MNLLRVSYVQVAFCTLVRSPGGGGGIWPTNIRGGAAGESERLPCPGVKFLKMIPCPVVKFSSKIPCLLVSSDKIVL